MLRSFNHEGSGETPMSKTLFTVRLCVVAAPYLLNGTAVKAQTTVTMTFGKGK